jgi:hypothetical protein
MSTVEIMAYLMIIGIIIGSVIISLIIAYIYVKLLFLISKRYIPHFCNQKKYSSGNEGEYTGDAINFVVFLKCLYDATHLRNIWSILRYSFRKCYTNSEIYSVNTNKENQGYAKCNQGSPKPSFHNDKSTIKDAISTQGELNHYMANDTSSKEYLKK